MLPTGPAEKIICLKNQNDLGLINGMFLSLDAVVDEFSPEGREGWLAIERMCDIDLALICPRGRTADTRRLLEDLVDFVLQFGQKTRLGGHGVVIRVHQFKANAPGWCNWPRASGGNDPDASEIGWIGK
jgi:hypothetical protein